MAKMVIALLLSACLVATGCATTYQGRSGYQLQISPGRFLRQEDTVQLPKGEAKANGMRNQFWGDSQSMGTMGYVVLAVVLVAGIVAAKKFSDLVEACPDC